MVIAKIKVSNVHANVEFHYPIPAGIIGAQVEFVFEDPAWDNLRKTVVFRSNSTKDVIMEGTVVTIPSELTSQSGFRLWAGIYGVNDRNGVAIPTLWADLDIINAATDPSDDFSTDPTLPVWAQIQEQINDLRESGGVTDEQVASAVEKYLEENPIDGGVSFETDNTLILKDGILSVNTTDQMAQDNTLPITSAGVYTVVGNIEALLQTI